MLKFTMANNAAASFATGSFQDTNVAKDNDAVGGIYLVDVANKKKYLVVVDADGHCVWPRCR